jgi:hypothetical protein
MFPSPFAVFPSLLKEIDGNVPKSGEENGKEKKN